MLADPLEVWLAAVVSVFATGFSVGVAALPVVPVAVKEDPVLLLLDVSGEKVLLVVCSPPLLSEAVKFVTADEVPLEGPLEAAPVEDETSEAPVVLTVAEEAPAEAPVEVTSVADEAPVEAPVEVPVEVTPVADEKAVEVSAEVISVKDKETPEDMSVDVAFLYPL